jgi:threonine dehydratase
MPINTPDIKVANVRRLGGLVELVGESYQEAQAYAQVGGSTWASSFASLSPYHHWVCSDCCSIHFRVYVPTEDMVLGM